MKLTNQNLVSHAHDSPCGPKALAEPPFENIALASFPGSGNTWARHLIETLSGMYLLLR